MKLGNQIILSFTGIILLLLIIGFTSQFINSKIKNKVIAEKEEAVTKIQLFGDMESYLYQSLINIQYYIDEPVRNQLEKSFNDSTSSREKIKSNVRAALQNFKNSLQKLETILSGESYSQLFSGDSLSAQGNAIAELESRVEIYRLFINQLFTDSIAAGLSDSEFFATTVKPFFRNNLLPLFKQAKEQIQTNLKRQVSALNNKLAVYSKIILFATIIAFLLSLLLAWLLYRSLKKRLTSLAGAAQDIGRGNLEKRIEVSTDDEIGQLSSSLNRMAENLSKITFSKEFVDDVIESIGDGLIVTDGQGNIQKVNSSTNILLGYNDDELIGSTFSAILTDEIKDSILKLDKSAELDREEASFIKKNGAKVPVSLTKAVLVNSDGETQGMVCVFSDITERKKTEKKVLNSLKEKEILLAEIHHRVKNNLAVISGLLQMQIWETDHPVAEQVLENSQLRVKSIALVHEKLYQSDKLSNIGFDKYVDELLAEIQNTYEHKHTKILFETDVAPLTFNINQAIPCSLLLNELIINNYKHAFKKRNEGKMYVQLKEKEGTVHLKVKDDGPGFKEGFDFSTDKSMGMTIINTLVDQLHGNIKAYNNGGAVFEISFRMEKTI